MLKRLVTHKITITALVVFLLALLPRVLGLSQFLTTDERLWWGRSRDFFGGIISPEFTCPEVVENEPRMVLEAGTGLACTLRTGHPGVITMWSGSLGIWLYYLSSEVDQSLLEFVTTLPVDPIDPSSIFWLRLPTAVSYAAFAALVFLILNKMVAQARHGYWVALLAALFLALSPFNIALSRVLHTDALETVLVTLTVLVAFYYWTHSPAARTWLLVSGALAGASFLSKTPALFTMPFMALLGLWAIGQRWSAGQTRSQSVALVRRVFIDGLLWFAAALTVTSLLWPALWIIPNTVIDIVVTMNFGYANQGHVKGNFFLGSISDDPGVWFYPVNWLLHVTPLVLVGVLLGLLFWVIGSSSMGVPREQNSRLSGLWRRLGYRPGATSIDTLFFLSLLFAILFTLFLMTSSKKQDRYLLPVYPFLHIVAAIGWVWLGDQLVRLPKLRGWSIEHYYLRPLVVVTIVLYGLMLAPTYPYYFTYFNPLLGGLNTAAQITTVGWGEGLEQAANYLNQKPQADKLTAVSWYGSAFTPYFVGTSADYFERKGPVISADYALVYINQKQRRLPDDGFFQFLAQQPLEREFKLNGVPYIWLYRMPGVAYSFENQRYDGVATLLGWEYLSPMASVPPVVRPGDKLDIGLWWEYEGKSPDEAFFIWLIGPDYGVWSRTVTAPTPDAGNPDGWEHGQIIAERGTLAIPVDAPPGDYRLLMGFYPETPANPDTLLFFEPEDTPMGVQVVE
ncbi:MAG: glycosyltransferase family 39 protein [Anaerolineae bacterium]|nr:glycosyltransferase family 39 protein [Anaerolineae bacterium]